MDVSLLIAILCTKNCNHIKEKQTHPHESKDTEAPMSLVIGRSHATPYSCIFHSTPPNPRHSLLYFSSPPALLVSRVYIQLHWL